MNRYKNSLRIVPLVVLLCAATLAWSQAPLAKGSFTLPMQARWGGVALAPGDYTFSISHNLSTPMVELSRDGRFVGFILAGARDDTNVNESSMLLQWSGNGYAVKELRIGHVAAFSYPVSKAKRSQMVADAGEMTVPVQTGSK